MKRILALLLLLNGVVTISFAQLPPGGGTTTDAPLDPGVGTLLAITSIYALIRLNRVKRKMPEAGNH